VGVAVPDQLNVAVRLTIGALSEDVREFVEKKVNDALDVALEVTVVVSDGESD